jgi:hypothetical protein
MLTKGKEHREWGKVQKGTLTFWEDSKRLFKCDFKLLNGKCRGPKAERDCSMTLRQAGGTWSQTERKEGGREGGRKGGREGGRDSRNMRRREKRGME